MTERDANLLSGQIVDETTEITIVELCRSCAVDAELVEAMIDEGIIEPTRPGRLESWNLVENFAQELRE